MSLLLPCPKKCGRIPSVEPSGGYGYVIACDDHYDADCGGDPPEYFTTSLQGVGTSRAGAIAAWNEAVEDWIAERSE